MEEEELGFEFAAEESDGERDLTKLKDFEEDLKTLSTPRLRLLEAQVFEDQTHLESRREVEDETDLLENIMEQNREEVACILSQYIAHFLQVDVENENESFLRELDTAIDDIQKWKYRPPAEEAEELYIKEGSEMKSEIMVELEELQGRCADEKKVHLSLSLSQLMLSCDRFILWKSFSTLRAMLMKTRWKTSA
jgi:hypothetical protein